MPVTGNPYSCGLLQEGEEAQAMPLKIQRVQVVQLQCYELGCLLT